MTIIEQRQAFRIFDQIRLAFEVLDSGKLVQAQKVIDNPSSDQAAFDGVFPIIDEP